MNYWIFQGKPEAYRFNDAIKNDLLNVWNVQKHVQDIKKGDKAIIWITGENSGCYALVDIVTDPAILGKSEDYEHWVPKDGTGRKHQNEDPIVHKVKIRLIHNLFDKPILKNK